MTQTIINAEDCSVQERSVSIRVLTVGTKQITQSMYRQLIENCHDLIESDEDGGFIKLTPTIWGWVNICTPECKTTDTERKKTMDNHYHVIYEINGELKRARVSRAICGPDTYGRDFQEKIRNTYDPQRKREIQGELLRYKSAWEKTFRAIEDAGQLFVAVSGVWK